MSVLSLVSYLVIAQSAVTAPAETPAAQAPAAMTAPAQPSAAPAVTQPVLLALPEDELAGEDEAPESVKLGSWESANGARTGGAVAVVLGFYRPSMADVNGIAESLNFPGGFGNEAIFMNGIRGYGYVGPHFRIGGILAQGDASVVDPGAEFDRSLDLRVNEGGITLEGVYAQRRWEAYAGGMVGVGNYQLTYSQTDLRGPRAEWSGLTGSFSGTPQTSTYTKTFTTSYTALNPWVGAKFKVLPWFAIDGNLGYHWGKAGKNSWVFSDEPNMGVKNSPALDASGLTGALEVTFGFFPY